MIKPLTSLRFLFAFMVFGHHVSVLLENSVSPTISEFLHEGFLGVSFFYVLSGFVLAYSYKNKMTEAEIGNQDFWSARFAKIYPLHLITLILAIPQELNNETDLPKLFNFLLHISLTQSFIPLQSTYYSFNGVAWSISNEAFFYFMFPYLMLWQKKKAFMPALIASIVGLSIYTLSTTISASSVEWVFKINPFFRIVDFIIGMVLYEIFKKTNQFITPFMGSLLEMASIVVFALFLAFHDLIPRAMRFAPYYWLPMSLIILVFSYQKGGLSRLLSVRYLIVLGEVSFAFYMIHQLIIRYIYSGSIHFFPGLLNYIEILVMVMFTVSLAASFVVHFYIEKPATKRIKDHFSRRKMKASIAEKGDRLQEW